MPDLPISGLTTLGTQSASDLFVVVEASSGVTKKEARSAIVSGVVSDTVYGSGWNGVTTISPSKNAVYDKIELIDAAKLNIDGSIAMTGNLDMGITNNIINVNVVRFANGGGIYNNALNAQINLSALGEITLIGTGISATTVPYLDASKILVSSSVTPTELGYVSGVTSAIQTQLNTKATDSLVVHLAGTETITGAKTFSSVIKSDLGISLLDTTYKTALDVSAADTLRLGNGFANIVLATTGGASLAHLYSYESVISYGARVLKLDGTGAELTAPIINFIGVVSLKDNTDNTKILTHNVSGITTATTRTVTWPDKNGTVVYTNDKLSAFASTTSAELAGVISDETGSGSLVFATSPTLVTPTLGVALGTSLGLGVTSSSTLIHTAETSTSALRGAAFDQYSSTTDGSRINKRKARGTFASPTTIVTGDTIGNDLYWGHDGTSFVNNAAVKVTSTGTIATGIVPTTMDFMTMTSGGVLTTGITIAANQNVTFANLINVGTSTDNISQIGYASIGAITTGAAYFSHTANATTTSYGFYHGSSGDTAVNAKTGQTVTIKNNNTVLYTFSGTGFTLASGAFLQMSSTTDAVTTASASMVLAGGVGVAKSIVTSSTSSLYFGDSTTDGTWRLTRSGNDLVIQRRESGTYVTKSTIAA